MSSKDTEELIILNFRLDKIFTYVLKSFLLLFQLGVNLHELLLSLIEFIFNGLDLLLQLTGFFFSLGYKN